MADSTLRLHVTGMTCGGCENAVKRTLMQMNGVKQVSASHAEEKVDVTYDAGKVTPETIAERIQKIGYAVVP